MRIAGVESCLTMNDDQQSGGLNVGQENVMERVLGTFDGLYDDATSFISSTATSIGARVGDVTRDLGQDLGDTSMGDIAGDIAGDIGETATSVSAAVVDKLNAAMVFAAAADPPPRAITDKLPRDACPGVTLPSHRHRVSVSV
jgi:hypothetical protein